jgi:hypothetical protein
MMIANRPPTPLPPHVQWLQNVPLHAATQCPPVVPIQTSVRGVSQERGEERCASVTTHPTRVRTNFVLLHSVAPGQGTRAEVNTTDPNSTLSSNPGDHGNYETQVITATTVTPTNLDTSGCRLEESSLVHADGPGGAGRPQTDGVRPSPCVGVCSWRASASLLHPQTEGQTEGPSATWQLRLH